MFMTATVRNFSGNETPSVSFIVLAQSIFLSKCFFTFACVPVSDPPVARQ